MSETPAERFDRDQNNKPVDRKDEDFENEPAERQSRRYVDPTTDVSAEDDQAPTFE